MDDFSFDIETFVPRISGEEIIGNLRAFGAERGGRPVTLKGYDRWPARVCSGNTVARRMGGWRNALLAAGIKPGRAKRYTEDELMTILEGLWRKLGRVPRHKDVRGIGMRCETYAARWGSLKAACILLSKHKRGVLAREQLLTPVERPRRSKLSRTLRYQILQRDHFRCTACGASPANNPAVTLEVDHIHPVSKGGTDDPANLRTLCSECNGGKGNSMPPHRSEPTCHGWPSSDTRAEASDSQQSGSNRSDPTPPP